MPEPLAPALDALRTLMTSPGLVRAVATGRRRTGVPAWSRAELRVVSSGRGDVVQEVLTAPGSAPVTRPVGPDDVSRVVDALLAEPFGSWHVQAADRVVQLRVTKRGEAQVHTELAVAEALTHDRAAQHLLPPDAPLFTALGADAAKRRQVDAFLRQVDPVVRRLAVDGRPLRVLDLGCGNAYLTMAAHSYLTAAGHAVRTVGVDQRESMATRNSALAAELGLDGMSFVAGEIAANADSPELAAPDLVLALHACDTATDDALALAVRQGARAILAAPCCHHDVQRQLDEHRADAPHPYAALTRQPILKERFADVLTDAVRADLLRLLGYRVDVVEFVDSKHTPRNAMIRAAYTGAVPTPRRVSEYVDLVSAWHLEPALAQRLSDEVAKVLG
ncbi:class I SAM-dependent methyltransferase [Spongisporangium articulatum]|uniref:Class I SAM-dependent methyltransferase n=1 Tax=Spongisporangium articulatum TaxID=3362603 RepID=A0ABW8AGY6_9ACTN